jgi:hypothetical protein
MPVAVRPTLLLAPLLLLAGCASTPSPESGAIVVRWHIASLAEVNEICNAGMPAKQRKSVWGCYRRTFDQCTVYTAGPDSREDPQLHDTLGHEVRHCFQGAFHR